MTQCNSELKSPAWNDAKVTAHHDIIPTAEVSELSKLSEAERGVYDLIKMRYLAPSFSRLMRSIRPRPYLLLLDTP